MNAQQHDTIELLDFGDVLMETRQFYPSVYYPDYYFGRGPFPGWMEDSLEGSTDRPIDLSTL